MEGRGFRDRTPSYTEANAEILGISFDTPDENKAFAEAENFPYRLLSDVDRAVGTQYGTARPADHQAAGFAKRNTFLIDPAGAVRRIYEVTDTAGHADAVLADIISAAGH